MGEPTPRPWEYDGAEINGPWDGKTIPTVVGTEERGSGHMVDRILVLSSANADLIVRAVNAHEALFNVVQALVFAAGIAPELKTALGPLYEYARTALKKAEATHV